MKTFAFILINKSNMKAPEHFSTAQRCADRLFPRIDFSNWIIVRDEQEVVDLSSLSSLTAQPVEFHRRLVAILEAKA